MSKSPFVSLHNHTELGSPLDGMNDTYDLFVRAKELDQRAVAITDHGTMTALYDGWKASKETGVKLIPGMEAYFTDDLTTKKNYHLVLLAKNEVGYRTLLRLGYESFKNQVSGYMGKKTPRISWEHIEKFNEGIIALTACSNGIVAKTLITDKDEEKALCHINRLHSIFKENFFLEIQPHDLYAVGKNGKEVNQKLLNEHMIKYSRDMGIPYVITCDAHYRDKDHAKYHDFMLAIKDKKAVDDPDRFRYGVQDMYLKSHEEIISFFGKDIAEVGMANSIKIVESCEEPDYIKIDKPQIPVYPVKDEPDYEEFKEWHNKNCPDTPEDKSFLRYKCVEGFKKKFYSLPKPNKKEHWARVKKELSVLEDKDFSSYMLIVADYINWAKRNGISVGPARGSGAGSLVSYITGITAVNPMEYDLIFERFHNSEKVSFPDIDTDFAKGTPPRVIEYLKGKYGQDNVASISNWSTLSPKVIIKDVARSLRLGGDKSTAFKISNHITSIMPDTKTIEEARSQSKEFDVYMREYPELYEYAQKLQGLTRNWSVHAAGVIISERPLYETTPLRIDFDTGAVVAQWEKTRCEENGHIKFDLLAIKTLNVIDNAFAYIRNRTGESLTMDDIPLDDEETFKMISRGETMGVFQLESSLTPLCLKIKPKNIRSISDINALGRPSCPADQRKAYIERRFGEEETSFRHPALKNALEKTYGVSLYEEGMMFIAKDCADWDLNQADALRKITKLKGRKPKLVEETKANFIADTMKKWNMKYEIAEDIWDNEIAPFGDYGFNLSHSISYSHISYYTAWLRRNYPTEFMCALLNTEDPNSDATQEYLSECKRMKIKISPPDVRTSKGNYFTIEENEIFTGLAAVKGVGDAAISQIIGAQPFNSLAEFFAKTEGRVVNKRVVQSLAKAGAFDSFGVSRKDIHDNYAKFRVRVQNAVKKDKPLSEIHWQKSGEEWDKKEILLNEKDCLGRTVSGSMHEVFAGYFSRNSSIVTMLNTIKAKNEGTKVKIEVIINNKIKEFKIKNGKNVGKKFAKYMVEDVSGNTAEMTVWADDYGKYRDLLADGTPIKAVCRVSEYMEQKSLSLSYLENVYGRKI